MAFSDVRKELDCSICLNIYTDPVTLKCGHNFCKDIIGRVLDTQEGSGVYFCPECREEFQERPELHRNITLHNIVENFQSKEPDQKESRIFCTYCIHTSVPAVKACLLCEASLCDNHLKVHSKSSQHVLSDLTPLPENRKCSIHEKILEYYCTEDSAYLCGTCRLHGEHQEHQVEALEEASDKMKENLTSALHELVKKREEMEQCIKSLQSYKRKVQDSAAGLTKRVTALFRDIRRQLDILERRVMYEVSRQVQQDIFSASGLIQELEIKKDELSRKMRHIEEICKMTDPLTVLQESDTGDLCVTEDGDDEDKKRYDELLYSGGNLDVAGISHTLHTGISDVITRVYGGNVIQEPAFILLDVDTANNSLHISDDRKMARRVDRPLTRPETPGRFQVPFQVMSSQSFSSGRHYWDVDVGGSLYWKVGMCYPSIDRTHKRYETGNNYVSWYLERRANYLSAKHDTKSTDLAGNFLITRVRTYLDYEAGQISFYELGIPIRHLHTFTAPFTAPFTEPLHVMLHVAGGYVKICGGNREV